MSPHSESTVYAVNIRAVGDVVGQISVVQADSSGAVVEVTIDRAVCRIEHIHTLEYIRRLWTEAEAVIGRLPGHLAPTHLGATPGTYAVQTTTRLHGEPAALIAPLAPQNPALPESVRIQIGPLVWYVLDQKAYRAIADLWAKAYVQFGVALRQQHQ